MSKQLKSNLSSKEAKNLLKAYCVALDIKAKIEKDIQGIEKDIAKFIKSRGWHKSCWSRKNWDRPGSRSRDGLAQDNIPLLDAYLIEMQSK